jgi:predicted dehydrogenase
MREIGVAVIGSGRIGTLRAQMAARHPAVRFLGVMDADLARAAALAAATGAQWHGSDAGPLIDHPAVDAVIVSTPEAQHVDPVLRALEAGKPVLVEKPIATTLADADRILDTVARTGGDLCVGYSRRFKECFLRSKEQLVQGRLGSITSAHARVYNSRAQAFAILRRDPTLTPVVDVLTYYVDLLLWFLEGNHPVEVVARSARGVFREAGYAADDATWAIVTMADGAVLNLGISYALPSRYPTLGQSDRVEILGREGTMIVDDDHHDHLLWSDRGIPHAYVEDHKVPFAFLGSNTAGDWALGEFWGPLANESRAWFDRLTTGRPWRWRKRHIPAPSSGCDARTRQAGYAGLIVLGRPAIPSTISSVSAAIVKVSGRPTARPRTIRRCTPGASNPRATRVPVATASWTIPKGTTATQSPWCSRLCSV